MTARTLWARRLSIVAAVTVAIAATVLPSAAAQARHPAAGRIRDVTIHSRTPRARIADGYSVPYGGGPVLNSNRTHLIFWQPAGSGLTFDPGYEAVIETFMRNVARASHSTSSIYGLTGQYTDQSGPAAYASTYGGALTATDKLPANGCQEPASTGPGWTVCLTDEQLQHEIERVVRRDRMPTGPDDVYFLVTPNGLGDCETASPSTGCALGGDVNGYCGYHSQTADGLVLYAVIPYNAVPGHCQSNNPRPNDSTADPALSTIAHEQIESITDPLGTAWIDGAGDEIADLCLTNFGPAIGGSGSSAWNEDINGGHYYLQEVWSNFNGGCEPRAKPDSVSFHAGRAAPRQSVWFDGHADDPQGTIVAYRWSFGDGHGATGKRPVHRYAHPGQYHVVLRTTDSWGNWAFYAATVTVPRADGRVTVETKSG